MTTTVTVRANGSLYPAKVTITKANGWPVGEAVMVASGQERMFGVGVGDTVLVTEEFHKDGYPPPAPDADDIPA